MVTSAPAIGSSSASITWPITTAVPCAPARVVVDCAAAWAAGAASASNGEIQRIVRILPPSLLPRGSSRPLDLRQRDAVLALVLPLLVLVGHGWLLLPPEEQYLRDPFVGVNLGRQGRRVRDLERHETFPLGLERRDVRNDPAPRVGRLANGDGEDVARDSEILHRPGEREGVWRHDTHVSLELDEGLRVERLRIDDGAQ